MTIPNINTFTAVLKGILYIALFYEAFKLIQFTRKNTLLHHGAVARLKLLSYIFTALLMVKMIVSIVILKNTGFKNLYGGSADAYTSGYLAGQFAGHYVKVLLQNIDLIFAVSFIWMLSFVIKKAVALKQEQELTI